MLLVGLALLVVLASIGLFAYLGSSTAINPGIGQSNVIAVVASKNSLTIYVNHQFVTKMRRSSSLLRLLK
jgi:hypothetical protein